jgi:hypothetical protein
MRVSQVGVTSNDEDSPSMRHIMVQVVSSAIGVLECKGKSVVA